MTAALHSMSIETAMNDPLAPIATKAEAFTRILLLLDQAKVHLNAAGRHSPSHLHPGFAGFTTPATFLKVNRAVRARVNVYLKNWSASLVDLNESFINTSGAMSNGAMNAYSTRSGRCVEPAL